MMNAKQNKKRILMFPWLAHGHVSPFLELAKKFSHRNFHVYFCSTPILLSSVKNKLSQNHYLSIQLVELNLPPSPELPPHRHTTNGLPSHLMPALSSAFNNAAPALFTDILKTLDPDFVIYDHNQLWAPVIASSHKIPAARFLTTGALTNAMVIHMINDPGKPFPFPEISFGGLKNMMNQSHVDASAEEARKERYNQYVQSQKKSCDIVFIKTSRTLEGKYMDYLSIGTKKKMLPVGPLIEAPIDRDEDGGIIGWLDKKGKASTVYVSFGSESFLSKEEITEMAHGLEISEINFIWVLRSPSGDKTSLKEALPERFVKRVGEKGLVLEGWAPQVKILGHSSTGAFLSHCGWSSLMESMYFGVPVIALPLQHDQPMNAKLVEAVGVGVEVKRDENERLKREEIAQVIRKIVLEGDGEEIRIKAKELSENIRRKGDEEIDGAVKELVQVLRGVKPSEI